MPNSRCEERLLAGLNRHVNSHEKGALAPPNDEDGSALAIEIITADEDLVVVNKPPGLLVHNSSYAGKKERSLCQFLRTQLGFQVFPVHRLDRGTSGVLLFARKPSATPIWQAALAHERSQKLYWALVRGRTLTPQLIDHPVKSSQGPRKEACSEVLAAVPSEVDRCSLVSLRLFSGRWQQARQHLAHLHHPVLGDSNHGDLHENRRYQREHGLVGLALHCAEISLSLVGDERRRFVATPLPAFSRLALKLGLRIQNTEDG